MSTITPINDGLKVTDATRIREIFAKHPAVEQSILYGSRALDLANGRICLADLVTLLLC